MTEIVLSERNLLTLLNKLDRYDESSCTIIKPCGTAIRVEPDEVHYGDRQPGVIHPLDDPALRPPPLRGGRSVTTEVQSN